MSDKSNDLLARWKNRSVPDRIGIPSHPAGAKIFPTDGQKRLWFFQQAQPDSTAYNYGTRYYGKGQLKLQTITKAWVSLCRKYPVLRSFYPLSKDKKPVIAIDQANPPLVYLDYSQNPEAVQEAVRYEHASIHQVYDLTKPFLCSLLIIRTGPEDYRFTFSAHHILVDEWSVAFVFQKLAGGYRALDTEVGDPVDFRDVAWQEMQQNSLEHLKFWESYIKGAQRSPGLQTDFPHTGKIAHRGSRLNRYLTRSLSIQIRALAKEKQLTLFELTFGLFALLLYRFGGNGDFLIASPVTKRNSADLQMHIGYLIETVLFRFSFDPKSPLEILLSKLKSDNRNAPDNIPVPLEALVSALDVSRDLSQNPLFEVMFVFNELQSSQDFGPDFTLQAETSSALETSKFDLTLFAGIRNEQLQLNWEYRSDLFSEKTIDLLADGMEELFKGVLDMGIDRPVGEYPVLNSDHQKLQKQKTTLPTHLWDHYPNIPDRFKAIVEQFPERIALSFRDISWSYGELDEESTKWARALILKNPMRKPIALYMDRSDQQVIAVLAVLKSGAPYLALDPDYPKVRLEYMLENSAPAMILHDGLSKKEYFGGFLHLSINEVLELSHKSTEPLPSIGKEDPAYLIYTSGSSGQPKGLIITHGNLLYSTASRATYYPKKPHLFYWTSSLSFDSSKAGLYWTLLEGGHLRVAPSRSEQDIRGMSNELSAFGVTHLLTLPSLYRNLLLYAGPGSLDSLEVAIVAGERCDPEVIEKHFAILPGAMLYNEYGPSEATVWATVQKLHQEHSTGRVPIGKPIPGTRAYVVDSLGNLAPPLVVGELWISGPGLAPGYLNVPDLTAEKFIDNPWGKGAYGKAYRTGDLVRWTTTGELEYFGRKDLQLKIRGQRVELEEIEAVCTSLTGVLEAAVIMHTPNNSPLNDPGEAILVCYYECGSAGYGPDTIKSWLKERLPAHMIPQHLVALKDFPRLPNGKINRAKLREIQPVSENQKGTIPSGSIAVQIAELFAEVTEKRPIYLEDNYFDLGGDSIKSIEFIGKARAMGLMITPNQLFNHPTVGELSNYLERTEEEGWDYLVGFRKTGSKPPLFCIHAGGGHVFFYKDLPKYLENRPVYGLQPSGAYADQEFQQTVEAMASDYLQAMRKVQKKGPYLVLAYCFSTVVGNEMSRQLRASGEQLKLIVVDTMTSPASLNSWPRLRMRVLAFASRMIKSPVKSLYNLIISRYSVLRVRYREKAVKNEEERKLESLRIHLMKLSREHSFSSMAEDIHLLLTQKDHPSVNRETLDSWKRITSGKVKIHPVPGEHMTLFEEDFIKTTAEAIKSCLDQIERAEINP